MLRFAALSALGYAGYLLLRARNEAAVAKRSRFSRANAVAGGPLSEFATLQARPDLPPVDYPFGPGSGAATAS